MSMRILRKIGKRRPAVRSSRFGLCVALVAGAAALGAWAEPAGAAADSWWNPAWARRLKLSFDNTGQKNADLCNFPILVRLTAQNFDFSKARRDGSDLRFVEFSTNLLAHEIERWDPAVPVAEIWVGVPRIPAGSAGSFIWLYYGNAGAPDAQNAAGVWDRYYQGVWHFNDRFGNGTEARDSSAYLHDGVMHNETRTIARTNVEGRIGLGCAFRGEDDCIVMPWEQMWSYRMMLEAWLRIERAEGVVLDRPGINYGGTWNQCLIKDWKPVVKSTVYACGAGLSDALWARAPLDTNWHHVVWEWGGGRGIYIDGRLNASDATGGMGQHHAGSPVWVGAACRAPPPGTHEIASGPVWPYDKFALPFRGRIDEMRLTTGTGGASLRSADWIAASYLTMTQQRFPLYGKEEAKP